MLPANIEINLLPKDPFLESPLGKILQWALSAGRYLVIVTELVVVISFATRFSLDRRVTDLNSAIHQKQIIIQSYGDLEERVLTVQKKIDSFAQVEQQFNLAEAFPPLSEIVPPKSLGIVFRCMHHLIGKIKHDEQNTERFTESQTVLR